MLALIACSKTKAEETCMAKDMYQGQLFKLSRQYVEQRGYEWHILSALYGVVHPDTTIDPYEQSLMMMTKAQKQAWAQTVNNRVNRIRSGGQAVLVLAGMEYLTFAHNIPVILPMIGMGIGERLQWLKSKVKGE